MRATINHFVIESHLEILTIILARSFKLHTQCVTDKQFLIKEENLTHDSRKIEIMPLLAKGHNRREWIPTLVKSFEREDISAIDIRS